MNAPTIVERDAVRAILITPDREVLLLRIRDPGRADGEAFWVAPGKILFPQQIYLMQPTSSSR
jgi:hypothetical protein